MKKTLLFLTVLFFSLSSFSQTLLVTGDTIKSTQDPCFETSASLTITNNSINNLDIHCEKVIIDTASGTQNYFCWGAECYGPAQYVSSSFNTLNPGESDNIDFGGYIMLFVQIHLQLFNTAFIHFQILLIEHVLTLHITETLQISVH